MYYDSAGEAIHFLRPKWNNNGRQTRMIHNAKDEQDCCLVQPFPSWCAQWPPGILTPAGTSEWRCRGGGWRAVAARWTLRRAEIFAESTLQISF